MSAHSKPDRAYLQRGAQEAESFPLPGIPSLSSWRGEGVGAWRTAARPSRTTSASSHTCLRDRLAPECQPRPQMQMSPLVGPHSPKPHPLPCSESPSGSSPHLLHRKGGPQLSLPWLWSPPAARSVLKLPRGREGYLPTDHGTGQLPQALCARAVHPQHGSFQESSGLDRLGPEVTPGKGTAQPSQESHHSFS